MTNANTEVWRIDRPNINQRHTTYGSITFRQGDLVSIFAGGCAQTGGSGLTWKRYVRPVSRTQGTDNQYHGLITIPGFGSLRNVLDAVKTGGIPITADPGPNSSLTLGYVDDGYGDNGYWGHDDGWWQQCNDLPDAWVIVAIQHNCATSADPKCIHGRALDLVTDATDQNGFPVNPSWVWTRLVGSVPNPKDVCSWSSKTGTNDKDDASTCATSTKRDSEWNCVQGTTPGAIAGHMNWISIPVTNVGFIASPSYDKWDSEYTFDSTSDSRSLYVSTQSSPQIEFDTRETIDKVPSENGVSFTHGLDSMFKTPELHGVDAETIGLLGLDCGHTCNTEFHPAYAFFAHTKSDPQDDTWVFFVKNFGNQGYCGSQEFESTIQTFTIRLPQISATNVALGPGTVVGASSSVPAQDFSYEPDPQGGGAFFQFSLPPASKKGVIAGELHLTWTVHPHGSAWKQIWANALRAGVDRSKLADVSTGQITQSTVAQVQQLERNARMSMKIADASEEPSIEDQLTSFFAAQPKIVQDAAGQTLHRFAVPAASSSHVLSGQLDSKLLERVVHGGSVQFNNPSQSPADTDSRRKLVEMLPKAP